MGTEQVGKRFPYRKYLSSFIQIYFEEESSLVWMALFLRGRKNIILVLEINHIKMG